MLPMTAMRRASGSGMPRPTPIGMAPRSSITGTMETSKTSRQWRMNILVIGYGFGGFGRSGFGGAG